MATTKPRTSVKRPANSRSVRVTKKKQGVSRKQAIVAAVILAVVGVVVVVATKASSLTRVNIVSWPAVNNNYTVTRVNSDATNKSSYQKYGFDQYVSVSRDKTKFAYGMYGKIHILNTSTGNELTSFACPGTTDCGGILWLPGDKRLVYKDSASSIRAINTDGTGAKLLVSANGQTVTTRDMVIQRGGTKLAYIEFNRTSGDFYRIITMNNDGSNRKAVYRSEYRGEGELSGLAWSPDGKKLAFAARTSGIPAIHNIRTINADGSGAITVKNLHYYPNYPFTEDRDRALGGTLYGYAWSPGGSSILYAETNKSTKVENLYQVNVSTKKVTQVTSNKSAKTSISAYAWLPDGTILYGFGGLDQYGNADYKLTGIKTVKSDGTASRSLFQGTSGQYVISRGISF